MYNFVQSWLESTATALRNNIPINKTSFTFFFKAKIRLNTDKKENPYTSQLINVFDKISILHTIIFYL